MHCFPSSDERQKIFDEHVEIYPVHFSETERDSFENLCVYGTANQTQERFAVNVDGFANIYPEKFLRAEVHTLGIFKYKTRLTEAGKNIREFHEKISRGKNIMGFEKIPCRYVAGLIPGEGATHAWTEIFDSGFWRAIDPTHDKICDESYIKISSGRDALDCSINQGVFTGGGKQTQEVKAIVRFL